MNSASPSFTVETHWRTENVSGLCCDPDHRASHLFCRSAVSVSGVLLLLLLQGGDNQYPLSSVTLVSVFARFIPPPNLGPLCIRATVKVIGRWLWKDCQYLSVVSFEQVLSFRELENLRFRAVRL
jgi:hypothetical protein